MKKTVENLDELPLELLCMIISYLDVPSLANFALVNKPYHQKINEFLNSLNSYPAALFQIIHFLDRRLNPWISKAQAYEQVTLSCKEIKTLMTSTDPQVRIAIDDKLTNIKAKEAKTLNLQSRHPSYLFWSGHRTLGRGTRVVGALAMVLLFALAWKYTRVNSYLNHNLLTFSAEAYIFLVAASSFLRYMNFNSPRIDKLQNLMWSVMLFPIVLPIMFVSFIQYNTNGPNDILPTLRNAEYQALSKSVSKPVSEFLPPSAPGSDDQKRLCMLVDKRNSFFAQYQKVDKEILEDYTIKDLPASLQGYVKKFV